MGNTIFIRDKRVFVRPLRNWIEAIQKLEPPITIKGCRSFVGMVEFLLAYFCLELQKLLKSIYNLTRKGRQFYLGRRTTKKPLMKSNVECKDSQFYIYLTDMEDFSYTLTPVSLLLVVHCTRFRVDSEGLLPTQARECQRQPKNYSIHRTRDVWFGNKYSNFFTHLEESWFWCSGWSFGYYAHHEK